MTMATDNERETGPLTVHLQCRSYTGAFVTIGMLLAFLFVANLYTLNRLTSDRQDAENLRSEMRKEIKDVKTQNQELLLKYSILKAVQANQIDQLRGELDMAAQRLGANTGQVLDRARAMVIALQRERRQQNDLLEAKLAQKADADDLAALGETVIATQTRLGSTHRTLDVLAGDLGATRSDLGNLLASTRDQVDTLRQIEEKDYREITLLKNHVYRVGHVGLLLRKTDSKRQRFNVTIIANDQEIPNKGQSAFEPILFYVGRARVPHELVITGVGSDSVSGYIRIPKTEALAEVSAPRI
jgi:hypothetical protein